MNQNSTERILAGLRTWIASAPPGARVPSSRALTAEYGASPVTVQKAMRRLASMGLVESRSGVGTFVRAVRPASTVDYAWQTTALSAPPSRMPSLSATQRTAAPDAIGLHSGYPARELLPERLVRQALTRAARTEAAMTRSPAPGDPRLQEWFAGELAAVTPPGVTPASARDALVVSGSQSALSSLFRAIVGAGRPLLVESPTYWGAILAAAQAGVELVPIASGPDGPDPKEVAAALARTGARAFYAQPAFANPTGTSWSAETGGAVLEAMRQHGAFLIEDDWARDLGIDADPRPVAAHDDDGHVVYVRSLTKSVSPALRVATVIARGPARERVLADRASEAMYVSGVLQAAALDVVTQPAWRTHLRGVRDQLRARRDLLWAALAQHAPATHVAVLPQGGLNLWVRLPERSDAERVVQACAADGLIITAGAEWFPAEPTGPYVRLNYAGEHPERFTEAAQILGRHTDPA